MLNCQLFNQRRRKGVTIKLEDKLVGLAIGLQFYYVAIGLWWFGWTIPPKIQGPGTPWIVSTISLVFVGNALTELDTV